MGNNEDSDDSDDYDYPDIVSREWGVEYFGFNSAYNSQVWRPVPDLYSTYIKPHVDQVLNSVTDIFANSKKIISINELRNRTDLEFNKIQKTWTNNKQKLVLINWEKGQALDHSQGKRQPSSKLNLFIPKTREIVSNNLNTYLEEYINAYFEDRHFWVLADEAKTKKGEDAYYKLINSLLTHYYTKNKGFAVEMQNKDTGGIVDGAVTIIDPRSPSDIEPCLGLDGDFEKRKQRHYYPNINCFI